MKTSIIAAALGLALCSCASLQNAGTAEYSVKPFKDAEGTVMCCEVLVRNGKEIASLEAHITKQGGDYSVDLKEQGVAAFKGQGIAADALKEIVDAAVKAALTPVMLLP